MHLRLFVAFRTLIIGQRCAHELGHTLKALSWWLQSWLSWAVLQCGHALRTCTTGYSQLSCNKQSAQLQQTVSSVATNSQLSWKMSARRLTRLLPTPLELAKCKNHTMCMRCWTHYFMAIIKLSAQLWLAVSSAASHFDYAMVWQAGNSGSEMFQPDATSLLAVSAGSSLFSRYEWASIYKSISGINI